LATVITRTQYPEYVGKCLVGEPWLEIDQALIDGFADLTGDHQFIHVDPVAAQRTPFGTTIAHGYLTLSLLPTLLESVSLRPADAGWGINYGLDRLRFISPVTVGSAVRATSTLVAVEDKGPGRTLMKSAVTVEIRGAGRPALAAESLVLWVTDAGPAAPA